MNGGRIAVATVAAALAGVGVLLLALATGDARAARAGLVVLLCVPLVRNLAVVWTDGRKPVRALAIGVSLLLAIVYAVALLGGT